jgi:tight adherence protein C
VSSAVLLAGGLAALAFAIALLGVAALPARAGQGGVVQSLAAIEQRYAYQSRETSGDGDLFAALPGWMRGLALRLSPSGIGGSLQRRLNLAGNPGRWTPDRILAVKGLGLLAFAVLGALYALNDPGLLILCVIVGSAVGFFLPDVLLYNSGQKRQMKLQNLLPDAIDMLTICVEAGMGFDAAMTQVARNTTGPLAAEFARSLQEMQIGKSRSQALRAMVDRTSVPELRTFVSAVVQGSELGIPVAQVLREQAKEMRVRRRQRAEGRAQQVPVKITFPLILCLFPALLIMVVGPGIIEIAHNLFHNL